METALLVAIVGAIASILGGLVAGVFVRWNNHETNVIAHDRLAIEGMEKLLLAEQARGKHLEAELTRLRSENDLMADAVNRLNLRIVQLEAQNAECLREQARLREQVARLEVQATWRHEPTG